MDFFTTNDAPVQIAIDGKPYQLPRFLLPAMKEWGATIRKENADAATAHLDADQKARFLTYFQPPQVDVMQLVERAVSADGAEYVCRHCMKAAKVADDVIDSLISTTDPVILRNLSEQLTMAATAKAKLADGADPLPVQPGASAGSVETTPPTTQSSESPTPA